MDEITIVIADDHALIRKGLVTVLNEHSDIKVIETENGEEALKEIRAHQPPIAILDVEMPKMTGFDVARKVEKEGLNTSIVFLTMLNDESAFNTAMDIGIRGYVLKENTVNEIEDCVRRVLSGKYYISPELSDLLMKRNAKASSPSSDKDGLHLLTPSESTILKQISQMKTSKEIANNLGISIKTVQNHRNNICRKLDLSGTHALLKFAMERSEQL